MSADFGVLDYGTYGTGIPDGWPGQAGFPFALHLHGLGLGLACWLVGWRLAGLLLFHDHTYMSAGADAPGSRDTSVQRLVILIIDTSVVCIEDSFVAVSPL